MYALIKEACPFCWKMLLLGLKQEPLQRHTSTGFTFSATNQNVRIAHIHFYDSESIENVQES